MMNRLRLFLREHREILSYLFFGVATTVVSWLSYALFVGPLHMAVTPGNFLSWVCAVTFAFITNKMWVFRSRSWAFPLWLREAAAFYAGRILSGLVELGGVPLLMRLGLDQTLWGVEGIVAKVAVSLVVIVLNYFLSRFIAFRKKS